MGKGCIHKVERLVDEKWIFADLKLFVVSLLDLLKELAFPTKQLDALDVVERFVDL